MADAIGTLGVQSLHPLQTSTGGGSLAEPPPGGAPGGIADVLVPTITNVTPADLELDFDEPLGFDVQDNAALRVSFVWVVFAGGLTDIIHDGDAFMARYAAATRTAIAGGWRFANVVPSNGWPGLAMQLRVKAIDTSGNESA